MKKILAIALAVAMVLSMASASAFFCDGINWTPNTNTIKCALPTIEVVEMVRSNAQCGYDFVESGCAAVVAGMPVYFAVKLTVPADVNPEWWLNAKAYLKTSNTAAWGAPGTKSELVYDDTPLALLTADGKTMNVTTNNKMIGEGTYWLTKLGTVNDATDVIANAANLTGEANAKWTKVGNDFTFGQANVFYATAFSSAAKVCAKVQSGESDGHGIDIKVGDYTVNFEEGTDTEAEKLKSFTIENADYTAAIALTAADGKVKTVTVEGKATGSTEKVYVGYETADGQSFKLSDGGTDGMSCGEAKFLKDIMGVFGFDFGTTTTYNAVKKTFGYGGSDDAVVSCSDYKVGTSAIVDAACEIDIPKTGDVSVIAYAVMAIVAAAGAMGLKK